MNQVIVNQKTKAQYLLLAKVGQGAYADVYKGQNMATNQFVAIKKMKSMKAADSAMAQKEIELMKLLKHKNIVKWIDDFRSKGIWYIVLEYCGKGDLQKYKEKISRIPEHHCKALIRGILEALIELHSEKRIIVEINGERKEIMKKKIAHRDLKLANILINDQYQLKLADFGFSKDFEDGWLKSFCGTPLTMAPQVLKREKYNQKCDVWSLGVITYFLLYNKYPFMPNKIDGTGLPGLTKAVTNRIPSFDSAVPVSQLGRDFISKCLQKSIDKRPFSHELLNHSWWQKSVGWTAITKQVIHSGIQQSPEAEAQTKLKLLFFGVCVQHIKKIFEGMLLVDKIIKDNINLLQKYYLEQPNILAHYLQLISQHLNHMKQRQIILTYEQETMKKTEKKQFTIKLSDIKCYNEFQNDIRKVIDPVITTKTATSNAAQDLVLFLIEETQKLMDSFNQTEVDEKVELFKSLARSITIDYDETLISARWGEREDMSELGIYVFESIIALTQPQVIAMINEEAVDDEDLESVWAIEHHIAESPNKDTTEFELAKLVLSILKISSNFNIDNSMQTEKLEFKNFELDEMEISI